MDNGKNGKGLGEVSFSCYLRTTEENFIQKLTDSAQYLNHSITSSPEFPSSRSLGLERKKTGEAEIGVFDAEKYYNMKLDEGPIIIDTASNHGHSKIPQVDLLHSKTKSRPGTPSVSSEASWNSQTALLRTYQRNLSQIKQNKVHGKGFFASLSCSGSCSDKKSVYINQDVKHGGLVRGKDYRKESIQAAHSPIMLDGRKQRQSRIKVKNEFYKPSFEDMSVKSNKDKFLAIPATNSGVPNLAVKKQLVKEKIEEEELRKSLEVFGSQMLNKEVIEMNLERKVCMLTWDAIPKTPNLPTSSVRSQLCEDIESDASSDLFEIENISGSGQPVMFKRHISDGMSSCMSPTPYEPSETSIEWSVVTASAAAVSVVSDYEEKKLTENIRTTCLATVASKVTKTKSIDKDVQGSRPSKLLGCKSQKAVRVAETAYRINDKANSHSQQPIRSVAPMPARKFMKADLNGEGFGFL